MAQLIPVDIDPFAAAPQAPAATLVPVDHDPFAAAPQVAQPLPSLFDDNGPDPYAAAPAAPDPSARPLTIRPSGTTGDVLGGIGSGLVRGVAAVPGMIGDISNAAGAVPSYLGLQAANQLGMLPPGETVESAMKFANSPLNQAPPDRGTLGAVTNALQPATTNDVVNGIQQVTGPLYQPTTAAGKAAQNIASFVPQSVLGPGNMVRNAVAYGVVPGAVSEAAGQAGSLVGPKTEIAARIAGGGLGAGVGHLGAAPTPVSWMIAGATRGVSDEQIAAAKTLQQSAFQQGIQLTPAEAIQHVTGGASNLGNIQRNIENMNESAPVMAQFFAQRPAQVQAAASNVFDQIAPRPTDPFQIGVAAQKEAEGAMANVRQDRTNAAGKFYAAAAGDQVPPSRMQAVAQQLDALAAQNPNNPALTGPLSDLRRQIVATPTVPGQPAIPGQRLPVMDPKTGAVIRYHQTPGTPAVPSQPETYITDVGQLDKIYGGLRDQYTGPPQLGQSGTDARAGKIAAQGLGYLNDELKAASPALAAGRTAHGIMTDRWVAPREAGPLGQITQTNDIGAQGNALFPSNPAIGSEAATAETVGRLPANSPALVRNYLETRFNEANQNNMPGPNQWGGAKFAAQTFGNSQQAENLNAGIAALPNGPQVAPSVKALADALAATGARQPRGSATSFNDQFHTSMEAGTPLGSAASLAASPEKALGFVRDWYQQRRIGTNAELMAQMLANPNGVDQIAAARAATPPDQYRSMLVQALLNRTAATVPVAAQSHLLAGQ